MGAQVTQNMCSSCSSVEAHKKHRGGDSYEIHDGLGMASEAAAGDGLLFPRGEVVEYNDRSVGMLGLPMDGITSTPWEVLCSQDAPGGFTPSQLCSSPAQSYPIADDSRGQRMQVSSMTDMRNDRISQWTQMNANAEMSAWAMPCIAVADSNELNLDPRPANYLADTYSGTIVLNPLAGAVWVDDNILKRDRIAKEIRLREHDLKEARIAGLSEDEVAEIDVDLVRLRADHAIVVATIEKEDQPAHGGGGGGAYQSQSRLRDGGQRIEHGTLPARASTATTRIV